MEDLRQECRMRNLATSGPKNVLIKRLRSAVTQDPALPLHQMVSGRGMPSVTYRPMLDGRGMPSARLLSLTAP